MRWIRNKRAPEGYCVNDAEGSNFFSKSKHPFTTNYSLKILTTKTGTYFALKLKKEGIAPVTPYRKPWLLENRNPSTTTTDRSL